MVQVEEVSKAYGDRVLFSDVTFHVEEGERCALVGRNGTGKTTLLRILTGEETVDSGVVRLPKGFNVGALPQHLRFDQKTILEEALLGLPPELREEGYRAEKVLSGLGFSEDDFNASPNGLSGGFQLRLALCKVLVGEPHLLLLDEPTNYLDVVAIRWLERYLRSWRGQVLFISHDRSFVNGICTHVIGIHRNRVVKVEGNLDKYRQTIQLQEETHERARAKIEKKKAHMESFVERFGSKATKASQAQSRLKAIEKMESMEALQQQRDLSFSFHYREYPGKRFLDVQNLAFSYDVADAVRLIHDLSFEMSKGERLAVIGKNGRGKSTILRLLSEELRPLFGTVSLGQNVALAYFGQTNIERLDLSKTVEEEVMHAVPSASYADVRSVCGAMLFSGDDAKKKISVLSGGERSRVLLAKILLAPANLLLLDEPTHHLDIESVDSLMLAIELFPGAVVLVSHDESTLRRFHADKMIICTKDSQDVFLGDYDSFLEKRGWEEGDLRSKKSGAKKSHSKEERRRRAERIQDRSRELQPVQKRMKKVEGLIAGLEREKHDLEVAMFEGAQRAGSDMQDLAWKHGKASKDLDGLYEELHDLFEKEEAIREKYQK